MAAPKTRFIPISELRIDERYQRHVRPGHVAKIVANFDPNLLGVLTVNDRSGVLYTIDGGHRLTVALELGLRTLECKVFTGLTAQEEARIYYELNLNRLRESAYERFYALRFAGDEQAVEIDGLIRKYGWKPSHAHGPGLINALSAVETIYNRDGVEGLDETLGFIKRTWNGGDRATEGQMIRGVAHFLRNVDDKVDIDEVTRKVALAAPAHILSDALYKNKQNGGGVPSNVARKILEVYNKDRRTKVRIEL